MKLTDEFITDVKTVLAPVGIVLYASNARNEGYKFVPSSYGDFYDAVVGRKFDSPGAVRLLQCLNLVMTVEGVEGLIYEYVYDVRKKSLELDPVIKKIVESIMNDTSHTDDSK